MAERRRKRGKVVDRRVAGDSPKPATKRAGTIDAFFGVLAGKTKKVATIEEINEAAAAGWAGLVDMRKGRVGRK